MLPQSMVPPGKWFLHVNTFLVLSEMDAPRDFIERKDMDVTGGKKLFKPKNIILVLFLV